MPIVKYKKKVAWIWGAIVSIAVTIGAFASHSKDALDVWDGLVHHSAHVKASIIRVDMQDRKFDEIVVRISNPTDSAESLAEPFVACGRDAGPNLMISAWQFSDTPPLLPLFPPPKIFPLNVPAGDTVETTLFFLKMPGVATIRDCRTLRFAWIDAEQARVLGETIKLPSGAVSLSVSGAVNG